MKPTIKVSISSVVFNLEDDAYAVLKRYLDELGSYFAKREGGKEIIEDIEARIAELLLARINSTDQPIGIAAVQEVVAIIGKPEELGVEEDRKASDTGTSTAGVTKKRLYRDPDNQIVSGVCGGMGAYFNVDPILFRLLFVILALSGGFFAHFSGGTVLLVYIILWIALPKATTMAQKLELRGESPTAANIERRIREELSGLGGKMKSSGTVVGRILKVFFIVLGIMMGLPILLTGLALIIALVAILVTGGWMMDGGLTYLLSFVSTSGISPALIQGLLLVVLLIPIMLLIYGGLRLLFRFKTKVKRTVGISVAVWFICLLVLAGLSMYSVKGYRSSSKQVSSQTIETKSDTLYVRLPEAFRESHNRFYVSWDSHNGNDDDALPLLWKNSAESNVYLFPKVRVCNVDDSTAFSISYEVSARGNNRGDARSLLSRLPVMYELRDSLITLSPLEFSKAHKWRGEFSELVIYVPKNKTLVMDDEIRYDADFSKKYKKYHKHNNRRDKYDNDDFWSDEK